MNFMLDKITYNLLVKISKCNEFVSDKHSDDLRYLNDYQLISHIERKEKHYYTIYPKGRVAIRNYRENLYLILFNKLVSIFTLLFALATLVITFYQFFKF